ncbi:chondroitin AC lyase [Dyadobacter jejuensis]|uniref:Chondroitin AC lyase n=1 Tax=Dyadobacter jejuensis TaxID=1082580 RepID=A0A316ALD6_9BACT|nr:polysaccharide lyase family 8 super-sandwich domain-containing protein [Dyadobacter jejuensis]PWJ58332.1 chondroitin AC lyase [Dyadobacter jejuensis]
MYQFIFCLIISTGICLGQGVDVDKQHPSVPVVIGMGATHAELEKVRSQVQADLIAEAVDLPQATALLKALRPDGTWPDIDYADLSRTGFDHSRHLDHMLTLARAYRQGATVNKKKLKKAVLKSLDFWLANDFICENWWWNEMGTPGRMIDLLLMMDEDLSPKQSEKGMYIAGRANMAAFGARPGGDLLQIAAMRAKQALYYRNEEEFGNIMGLMGREITVSTGRGLQADMSFQHRTDRVISTLAYGVGFAKSYSYWAAKTAGTSFQLPEKATQLVVDYFLDGICQSMVYGKYPDPGALNREITRAWALSRVGDDMAGNLIKASPYRNAELQVIVQSRREEPVVFEPKDAYFWHSHYYSHQRSNYFTSVRIHSDRASNIEQPHNDEGILNHHLGDGSNFISVQGTEYSEIFPVWDWQKVPGTTVVQKPELPHWKEIAKRGKREFAGGLTDGRYGVVVFDFESVHDPLKAKKSWFFFDKEYMCLGTSITSTSSFPVATTLNQSLLKGPVRVKGRFSKDSLLRQGIHDLTEVEGVWHDRVGYIFPVPRSVQLKNTSTTGNWRRINHQLRYDRSTVKMDVFSLWLDHGIQPSDEGYEYVVVPDVDEAAWSVYEAEPVLETVHNDGELQAVWHKKLQLLQAIFYTPGELKHHDLEIRVEKPCLLMLQLQGKDITSITVADPTTQLESIQIALNGSYQVADPQVEVRWDPIIRSSILSVSLPEGAHAGSSLTVDLGR